MLRFCEACNGCSFYFLVKTVFASYYLKLSLSLFLKCFSFLPNFGLMFLLDGFLIKKACMLIHQAFFCLYGLESQWFILNIRRIHELKKIN